MNAITIPKHEHLTDNHDPLPHDNTALYGFTPSRYDGWTPERQKIFLQAISEGMNITHACRIVGLSKQSAYAFRRRPQGAGFALAWQAACLLSRDSLADELMERAMNGVTDTFHYRTGETAERHRHDNRLAMAMLNRLDRLADRASRDVSHAAARLVAAEFDPFLDCLERGPARAGMFLGARAEEATASDLEPVRTLARADRWLRTHTTLAGEVDASDLDPAARKEWTAEQWSRAEDSGLVTIAADETENAPVGQIGQPTDADDLGPAIWWEETLDCWRTRYPAPPGFFDDEEGEYGDEDYSRALTAEEIHAYEAPMRAEIAERAIVETAERDALFGFVPAGVAQGDAAPKRAKKGKDWEDALDAALRAHAPKRQ